MTSVASAAAQLPAVSHADEAAAPGFIQIPSHLDGFVQTGTPQESARTEEFGTSTKRCQRAVQILTVPGRIVAKEAPCCPCCGQPMEKNGQAPITLRHLPLGMERARIEVSPPKMGMQGVRAGVHRRGTLQGVRSAHHAAAPDIRV